MILSTDLADWADFCFFLIRRNPVPERKATAFEPVDEGRGTLKNRPSSTPSLSLRFRSGTGEFIIHHSDFGCIRVRRQLLRIRKIGGDGAEGCGGFGVEGDYAGEFDKIE